MTTGLVNRLRRAFRRRGGTMPRSGRPTDAVPVLLSRGVAYLPDGVGEEFRRTAEKMGYEVRGAGEGQR